MANWKRRVESLLKKEKENNKEVWDLYRLLIKEMHGFNEISKEAFQTRVMDVLQGNELMKSEVKSFSVDYLNKKDPNPSYLNLHIRIEGEFNGDIKINTGSGYRKVTEGQESIYYISNFDCSVVSDLKKKCDEFNERLRGVAVEEFIKLAIDGKHVVSYDDLFKRYSIVENKGALSDNYSDIINGWFDDNLDYLTVIKQLKQLQKSSSPLKYAEESDMYGMQESKTFKWMEYELGKGWQNEWL